ncbi:hypothetical protein ACTS95_14845 [Empedobacter brevis]
MENTIPTSKNQLNQLSEVDRKNLKLLEEIAELNENFTDFAKSVNEVFYLYVQTCLFKEVQLQITQNDVFKILEVVNLFNNLKINK